MNTDFGTHVSNLKQARRLGGDDLTSLFLGKTAWGTFGPNFLFTCSIAPDGRAEGVNNAGTRDTGLITVNMEQDALATSWHNHWITSHSHAYAVGGQIKCYDSSTGNWLQSFTRFEEGVITPLPFPG